MLSGQELTCHYRYDMRDALRIPQLQWYVEQWDRLTQGIFEARKSIESDEVDSEPDALTDAGAGSEEDNFIQGLIDEVIRKVVGSVNDAKGA